MEIKFNQPEHLHIPCKKNSDSWGAKHSQLGYLVAYWCYNSKVLEGIQICRSCMVLSARFLSILSLCCWCCRMGYRSQTWQWISWYSIWCSQNHWDHPFLSWNTSGTQDTTKSNTKYIIHSYTYISCYILNLQYFSILVHVGYWLLTGFWFGFRYLLCF